MGGKSFCKALRNTETVLQESTLEFYRHAYVKHVNTLISIVESTGYTKQIGLEALQTNNGKQIINLN